MVGSRPALLTVLVMCCTPRSGAAAADAVDAYVGVSLGQAHVAVLPAPVLGSSSLNSICCNTTVNGTAALSGDHFAFKALLGTRPVSLLGAEAAYVDLGTPHGALGGNPATAKMSGETLFGLLYLPTPVIDTFLKAGAAHLRSQISGDAIQITIDCFPGLCTPPKVFFRQQRTDTEFAFGAGIQHKIGSLAMRAEFERFTAADEHPTLITAGLTWSF
jgi:hypothetical protein